MSVRPPRSGHGGAPADPAAVRPVTGMARRLGTFGELLQGVLPEDSDFLVTLPIARWARVAFPAWPGVDALEVRPAHKHKSLRLAG